jgi:diguanylate cyclase (GGDEF)-like protein
MKKDLIAVYLNEHPEFFNEYPELLQKIQSIEQSDIPLEPLQTLSIADRIIKRAHDDKEHMKSRLEWFAEIIEANEALQERLFDIETAALSSLDLSSMLNRFCEDLTSRFKIPRAQVCLLDDSDLIESNNLRQSLLNSSGGNIKLMDPDNIEGLFPEGSGPILRSEIKGGSELFGEKKGSGKIQSEIVIPIHIRGQLAGALCMGSEEPYRFYDGLRTDFLIRTAEKLGIAVDNILLMEKLGSTPLIDSATGFYNATYMDFIIGREFGHAKRTQNKLSSVKISIDNFEELIPEDEETVLKTLLKSIRQDLVAENIIIRENINEYLVLLPRVVESVAKQYAKKVQDSIQMESISNNGDQCHIKTSISVVSYPSETATTIQDLMQADNSVINIQV